MGIIKKILSKELNGLVSGLNTEIYPITAAEAVFDNKGTNLLTRLDRLNSTVQSILSGEGLLGLSLLLATNYILAYIVALDDSEALSKLNRSEKTDIPTNYNSINNILMKEGYYLYMTTCRKKGSTYLTYSDGYIWSTPIRMGSGYTTSTTGNDGDGYNYIYCRTLKDKMPNIPNGLNVAKIESLPSNKGVDVVNVDIINDVNENTYNTWCDHPLGVTKEYPFEWIAIAMGSDSKGWGDFLLPVLWSNFGFNGMDGDGIEYIFRIASAKEDVSSWGNVIYGRVGEGSGDYYNVYTKDLLTNVHYLSDDFIPQGWHDNPQLMTNLYPVQYVALRKKKWEVNELDSKWLMFSDPKVWTNLASGYFLVTDNDSATLDDDTLDAETIKIATEATFKVLLGLIDITKNCTFSITEKLLPSYLDVVLSGNKGYIKYTEGDRQKLDKGSFYYIVTASIDNTSIATKKINVLITDITADGSTYKLTLANDTWSYTSGGELISTLVTEVSVSKIFKGEIEYEDFSLTTYDEVLEDELQVVYPDELKGLIDFDNSTISPSSRYNPNGYTILLYYKGILLDSEHIDCLKNGLPGKEGGAVIATKYYYRCDKTIPTGDAVTEGTNADTWDRAYRILTDNIEAKNYDFYIYQKPYYVYSDGTNKWGNWELNEAASKMGTKTVWIGDDGIYAGTLAGDHIIGGTIDANLVGVANLEVGKNVTMGADAKITWTNVTSKPTIPTNTNQLINGAEYQTKSQVESAITGKGYYTKNLIETLLSGKDYLDGEALTGYLKSSDVNYSLVTSWLDKVGKDKITNTYIDKDSIATSVLSANRIFAGTIYADNLKLSSGNLTSVFNVKGSEVTLGKEYNLTIEGNLTAASLYLKSSTSTAIKPSNGVFYNNDSIYSNTKYYTLNFNDFKYDDVNVIYIHGSRLSSTLPSISIFLSNGYLTVDSALDTGSSSRETKENIKTLSIIHGSILLLITKGKAYILSQTGIASAVSDDSVNALYYLKEGAYYTSLERFLGNLYKPLFIQLSGNVAQSLFDEVGRNYIVLLNSSASVTLPTPSLGWKGSRIGVKNLGRDDVTVYSNAYIGSNGIVADDATNTNATHSMSFNDFREFICDGNIWQEQR